MKFHLTASMMLSMAHVDIAVALSNKNWFAPY